MTETVSIVVPIYNGEKYLTRCIKSILSQSYREIQLILVNDGSADHSLNICNEFAHQDARIVVVNQSNTGVSGARNSGIKMATGAFLTFVDADDALKPDAIKIAYETMEKYNADMVTYGWEKINEEGRPVEQMIPEEERLEDNQVLIRGVLENYSRYGGGYPWNKLWRKSAFSEGTPLFDPKLYYFEDLEWVIRAAKQIKKTAVIPEALYDYTVRSDSATNAKKGAERRELGYHESIRRMMETIECYPKIYEWFADKYYPEIVNGIIGARRHQYGKLERYLEGRLQAEREPIKKACNRSLKLRIRAIIVCSLLRRKT